MRNDTRKLTEGAMTIAIIGVFVLIDRQLGGLLAPYILYIYPLPMLLYSAKYGLSASLPVLAGMLFILFIFTTPASAIYFTGMIIIGLVYGSLVYRGASNKRIVITTMILGAIVEVVAMILMMGLFGYNVMDEVTEMQNIFEPFMDGAPEYMQTNNFFLNMVAIATILNGILEGLICHFFGRILLKRFNIKMPKSEPIQEHFPPKIAGYIGILGFVAYYATVMNPLEDTLLQTSVQCLGIACIIYLVAYGCIAIYVYFLTRPNKPSKIFIFLMFMLAIFMLMFTSMLGFLYITTNWHENLLKGDQTNATKSE